MKRDPLASLIQRKFQQRGVLVPARLQAALALLERLRIAPELTLDQHLSQGGQSLLSHETLGAQAHERLKLEAINQNHGRRSSSIRDWGQDLLDLLSAEGFGSLDEAGRSALLSEYQEVFAEHLRRILDLDPIMVRVKHRTAEAVIADVLNQAEAKGRLGPVAQYLVGAKLMLRFPDRRDDIPVHPANKGDRRFRGDADRRRSDFDLSDFVIEVTVAAPDAKHIDQIGRILEDADVEVWLLVRGDRLQFWKDEVSRTDFERRRLVVASIELFIGQNVTEMGGLSLSGKSAQLEELFDLYNREWIDVVGSPGMRIVTK